jgi:hypothetical protein
MHSLNNVTIKQYVTMSWCSVISENVISKKNTYFWTYEYSVGTILPVITIIPSLSNFIYFTFLCWHIFPYLWRNSDPVVKSHDCAGRSIDPVKQKRSWLSQHLFQVDAYYKISIILPMKSPLKVWHHFQAKRDKQWFNDIDETRKPRQPNLL